MKLISSPSQNHLDQVTLTKGSGILISFQLLQLLVVIIPGLDTFMSEQLVNSLKHLTLKGRSVLCTIHQPSAETFDLFDKLLLMKKGQVVFEGHPGQNI